MQLDHAHGSHANNKNHTDFKCRRQTVKLNKKPSTLLLIAYFFSFKIYIHRYHLYKSFILSLTLTFGSANHFFLAHVNIYFLSFILSLTLTFGFANHFFLAHVNIYFLMLLYVQNIRSHFGISWLSISTLLRYAGKFISLQIP